jgi:hypothetical protein
MQKQKIWVKPSVKVYTKNDVLGKGATAGELAEGANSKTGS